MFACWPSVWNEHYTTDSHALQQSRRHVLPRLHGPLERCHMLALRKIPLLRKLLTSGRGSLDCSIVEAWASSTTAALVDARFSFRGCHIEEQRSLKDKDLQPRSTRHAPTIYAPTWMYVLFSRSERLQPDISSGGAVARSPRHAKTGTSPCGRTQDGTQVRTRVLTRITCGAETQTPPP